MGERREKRREGGRVNEASYEAKKVREKSIG